MLFAVTRPGILEWEKVVIKPGSVYTTTIEKGTTRMSTVVVRDQGVVGRVVQTGLGRKIMAQRNNFMRRQGTVRL